MLHRLNFITGIVMLVVAGTLVFVVTRRDDPPAAGKEAYAPEMNPRDSAAGYKRPRVESRTTRSGAVADRPGLAPASATAGVGRLKAGQLRSDLRVEVDKPNQQHGDLEQSAQRVEAFALRRLGVLTEQLDLTAAQQARIFPILARGSQSYDPRMRIVAGSQARPLGPAEDPSASDPLDKSGEQTLLQKELNPAQSDELIDQSIKDLLIWEEIIDGLAYQLDQATPGQVDEAPDGGTTAVPGPEVPAGDAPIPATDPAARPASHGGRNLFDPLVPAN